MFQVDSGRGHRRDLGPHYHRRARPASTAAASSITKARRRLTDCTISGNSAKTNGVRALQQSARRRSPTAPLTAATQASDGGGLVIGGMATLTGCTISSNYASVNGGGLYNKGTTTLEDTIVAANTGSGSSASDIHGSVAVSSSYNLIGTGGSGGLTNGSGNNIVLTSLVGLGLAPLGDYGGPTGNHGRLCQASAAIGAGTAESGITIDQRGAPRPTSGAGDIGAFEDQGYTVAVFSGSPQSTQVGQAFNAPIVALLTEDFANAPLPGVTVDFIAPNSGASATLSASSVVTDASGLASVTATANAIAGTYAVTASATGVTSSASTRLVQPDPADFLGAEGPARPSPTVVPRRSRGRLRPIRSSRLERRSPSRSTVSRTMPRSPLDGSFPRPNSPGADVGAERELDGLHRHLRLRDRRCFPRGRRIQPTDSQPGGAHRHGVGQHQGIQTTCDEPRRRSRTITSGSLASGDTSAFIETYSTRNVKARG